MSKLAAEFGISGNGLAKICDRLKVPYPGRGYWARKEAGQKVAQYRLPEAEEGTPLDVTISPTPPPPAPPKLPKVAEEKIEAALSSSPEIVVPEKLERPHRVIAGWIDEREKQQKAAKKSRDTWGPPVTEFTEVDHRRHRILDTLFKLLECKGVKVVIGEYRRVRLESSGEQIEFDLKQKNKQIKRPLTEQEKKWQLPGERPRKQELQPTGALVFAIKTYFVKQEWIDKDNASLEKQLPNILAALLAAGPWLAEQRKQREEAEKRYREQERLRYEKEEQRKQDNNRWRRFLELAHNWKEAEIARQFLSAIENGISDKDAAIGKRLASEWIEWAKDRLESHDPLSQQSSVVFEDLSTVTSLAYRN